MAILAEPIGSIPRAPDLDALASYGSGEIGESGLAIVQDRAVRVSRPPTGTTGNFFGQPGRPGGWGL